LSAGLDVLKKVLYIQAKLKKEYKYMAKITWKAGTMLAPVPPALISCGTMEKPNVMTAAWTGIVCTEPTLVYVSLRQTRYSHKLIKENGEFVINVPTVDLAKAVDLCGVKSGKDVDKFTLAGITAEPCTKVKAPQVAESPVSLECKVKNITTFGSHDMFLGEVVAVNVDDALIGKNGALNLGKAGLLAYAHGFYYGLGKKIGKFGWSVEKKTTKKKRAARKRGDAKNG
jgi:flavin reductase (DIM6/NTAB) family NADH-FMN oxidoreductase RutF